MEMGLQVIFGGQPSADLPELREKGFSYIRCDCQVGNAGARASEVLAEGMTPLVIIRSADQIPELAAVNTNGWVQVELGNEPDLAHEGWTPASYYAEARRCIDAAFNYNIALWIGVISNLNDRGFSFLEKIWQDIPPWVNCSVHRYPTGGSPYKSHMSSFTLKPPFKRRWSRFEEVDELRRIVGKDRKIGVSETGYSMHEFSEEDAAYYMQWERQFWMEQGAVFCVAYQLNDGAGSDPVDKFGFRRLDGTWRADLLKGWTGWAA